MKEMTNVTKEQVMRVVSEPGDITRYDYFVVQWDNDFMFMPYKSTFKFPQKINYWDIEGINTLIELIDSDLLLKYKDVNPHTIMECIRTIKDLKKIIDE